MQVGSGVAGTTTTSVAALGTSTVTLSGGTLALSAGNGVGGGLTGQYYNVPPIAGNTDFASATTANNLFNALTASVTAPTTTGSNTTLNFTGSPNIFSAQGFSTSNGLNFQARMSGKINITTAGTYTFGTTSDDGSVVFIDGQPIVINNAYQGVGAAKTGTINLTPGLHDISVGYYQGNGGAALTVLYQPPGATALTAIPNSILAPAAGITYGNNLSVTASSALASTGNVATMGTLSMAAGATATVLTVNGGTYNNSGGAIFTGTTLTGATGTGTAVTFSVTGGQLNPGAFNDGGSNGNGTGATPTVTINKTGLGNLILDTPATSLASNTPINVNGGGFLGLVGGTGGIATNLSAITLGNASSTGGLALGTRTAGNFPFDQPMTLGAGGATIMAGFLGTNGASGTAGTPIIVTLGQSNNYAVTGGTLQLESNNNYLLNVAGALTGPGAVNVEAGSVTYANAATAYSYGGGTTVSPAGTMKINTGANVSGTGAFNVTGTLTNDGTVAGNAASLQYFPGNGGGTIKGSGTFGGTMSIAAQATLAPGDNSAGAIIGNLTVSGAVTFAGVVAGTGNSGPSVFSVAVGPGGAGNELIVGSTGTLSLGTATGTSAFTTLALTNIGGNPSNTNYVLVDNKSARPAAPKASSPPSPTTAPPSPRPPASTPSADSSSTWSTTTTPTPAAGTTAPATTSPWSASPSRPAWACSAWPPSACSPAAAAGSAKQRRRHHLPPSGAGKRLPRRRGGRQGGLCPQLN